MIDVVKIIGNFVMVQCIFCVLKIFFKEIVVSNWIVLLNKNKMIKGYFIIYIIFFFQFKFCWIWNFLDLILG